MEKNRFVCFYSSIEGYTGNVSSKVTLASFPSIADAVHFCHHLHCSSNVPHVITICDMEHIHDTIVFTRYGK